MKEESDPKESFSRLRERASVLGISDEDICILDAVGNLQVPKWSSLGVFCCFMATAFAICLGCYLVDWPVSRETLIKGYLKYYDQGVTDTICLAEMPDTYTLAFRPPVDCGFCRGVTKPHRVQKLDPYVFEASYAYAGQPVVVEDAMQNWTAQQVFSFEYFKSVYPEGSSALEALESQCQFFPYQTDFQSMGDVFRMGPKRARLANGTKPWYIGWSNCVPETANKLRQHYTRPYFLPVVSQSSKTDWIFIGSPGYGAQMHIDNVVNPSWQSQIRGQKLWMLEPPPECYKECQQRIDILVKTGETIVLDTNRWFHSTLVIGNDISVTIGSEYD